MDNLHESDHGSQGSDYDSDHHSRQSTRSPEVSYRSTHYDRPEPREEPRHAGDVVMADPQPSNLNITLLDTQTATFAWSKLVPASKMTSPPTLYIERKRKKTDDDWRERLSEALGYTVGRSEDRLPRRPAIMSRKRSLDLPPVESLREPARTPLYESRTLPSPTTHRIIRKGSGTPGSDYPMSEPEMDQFDEGEDEVDPPEPSSARQIAMSTSATSAATPSQKPWHHYAKRIQNPAGAYMYLCLWGGSEGRGPCNYESKKQLVKRHIETTHLGIKPYLCTICKKSFPQKTHLEIHLNAHTKEKPYECMYDGCKEAFGDLSRRFKHYRSVHGYQPKQYKKKFKPLPAN